MVARKESEVAPLNQTSMELKGDREIVIAHTFNASEWIVFDAWTKPELVRRWWAPGSLGVSVVGCDAAVRVGGNYRYVLRLNTGNEFAFSGRYTEVTPHSRLVYTQIFEPTASGAKPGDAELLITVTFDEHNGKTNLVSHSLCPSKGVGHGARHARDLGPARRARRFALLNRQAVFHIGLSRTDSGAFLRIGHTPTFTPGLILTRLEGRAALFQSRLSCMAQRVQATPRREKLSLKRCP